MGASVRVERKAEDKKAGMTLDELAAFVQEAMRHDVPGDTRITALAGFRAQLQAVGTA